MFYTKNIGLSYYSKKTISVKSKSSQIPLFTASLHTLKHGVHNKCIFIRLLLYLIKTNAMFAYKGT